MSLLNLTLEGVNGRIADSEDDVTAVTAKLDRIDDVQSLTAGATVAVNMATHSKFTLAPVQNFTLSNPTGATSGQRGTIMIVQDSTGTRVITWGTSYQFSGGTDVTLTTTAAAVDLLTYEVLSPTRILITGFLDIKD